MDMVVCNTFVRKEVNHQGTIVSRNLRSQIDYMLVRKGNRRAVSNNQVIPYFAFKMRSAVWVTCGRLLLDVIKKCGMKHISRLKLRKDTRKVMWTAMTEQKGPSSNFT